MPHKMNVEPNPNRLSFRLKALGAAVISAVVLSNAGAAGLGKLTVLSALGQPLNAEIELTSVTTEEAGSLVVRLASADAFRQANIDFNPALLALRFAVEQRNGRQVVKVTSAQPINEPFVDMLLEVGGGSSRLVREYTFLLDPPDLRRTQSPQVAAASGATAPPASRESARAPQAAAPAAAAPARPSRPAPAQRAAPSQGQGDLAADSYRVKSGDTLAGIAGQHKPEGVSLDQMLVALQRANPSAFGGNNINRLRAGQILAVPDAETARSVSSSEARSIVITQSADFNGYRNKLASQVAGSKTQNPDQASQSASGRITAKVEEQPNAASESKDKLRLSRSGAAGATGADKASGGGAAAEDRIAGDKALAEANARVRELEKNVSELQKLLELKNKDLAERQNQAGAGKTETAVAAAAAPATAMASAAPAAGAAAPAPSAAASGTVAPGTGEAGTAAATAAPTAPAPVAATAPEAAKPATPAKPKPPIAVTPPPEPSFIDSLLDNPLVLALIAILVAALGALGIRRAGLGRKKEQEFEDSGTLTESSGLKANSLFASTGGQSVDTSNSVFNSNFSPSASQLDTNEVDPVAEADVYIAYGRDAQAEEILKEALRTQPDRNAVRVKLLEIYASRNDLRAFETTASELYGRTKGEGEEWQQAASLGIGIDPKNPMYAGGKVADATEQDKPALGAPSNSADELDLDGLLNTTQAVPDAPEQKAPDFPAYGKSDADDVPVLPVSAPPTPAESAAPPAKDTPAQDTADNTLDFDFDLNRLGHADAPAPQTEWKPADAKSEPVPDLDFDPNSLDFDVRNYAAPAAKPGDEAHADDTPLHIDFPEVSEPAGAASEAPREPKDPTPLDFDLSNISLDLDIGNHGAAAEAIDDGNTNVAEMATKLDLALAYQEIGDQEGARELLDEVIKGGNTDQSEKARALLEKLA